MSGELPGELVPVVECSECHRPYVLRVAFVPETACWEYLYGRDCACKRGQPFSTMRTAIIRVLDRIAAADVARRHPDELSRRRQTRKRER